MFLSQLLVNTGDHPDKPRPGLDWIKQTYRVHQRIWMAFPSEQRLKEDPFFVGTWSSAGLAKDRRATGGFLFRIEPDPPLRVLVQSVEEPKWDYAFANAKHLLAENPKVRGFDPECEAGRSYRFRLVMQMVKRRTVPVGKAQEIGRKRRTEHPIRCLLSGNGGDRPDPNFTAWRERLAAYAERCGFTLGPMFVQPVSNLTMKPEGRSPPQRCHAALFDGQLTCDTPSRLREAVVNGVGRGKAFGMGLLSLAKVV